MPHRVTRSQEEVFLAHAQLAHSSFYNLMDIITIKGPLDPARLHRAITRMMSETDTLNFNFTYQNGGVRPVPRTNIFLFEERDVSAEDDPTTAAQRLIDGFIHEDLDIQRDVLLYFRLIKVAADTWMMAEYCNHISLDGWGHSLIYNRIVELYNHPEAASSAPLGQQADLNACEARYASSPSYEKDRTYWTDYCDQLAAPLRLSYDDRPANALLRFRARLKGPLEERLRTLAAERKLRLSSLLLTMFSIFLGRMSGQPRFTVGMPVAARVDKQARNIPSMLANILPMEIVTQPDDTLDDVTRHINRTLRRHLLHQCYRYEDMVRDRARQGASGALFHMTLNVVAYDQDQTFEGCTVSFQNVANGPAEDLGIDVFDRNPDGSLEIGFNANGSVYSPELLQQYYDRFLLMAERITAAPETPIGQLSLLTDQELAAIRDRAQRPLPPFESINDRFAAVCDAHGARTAIVADGRQISYATLAHHVNALAHRLAEQGVRQGDRVGVMMPRGIEWVTSLLALYHLGATYLPINPELPTARIRYMLDNARVRLVMAQHPEAVHDIDASITAFTLPDLSTLHAHQPAATLTPDTEAYLIYTSGSTGHPKGVMVPHQGLVDEYTAMQQAAHVTPDAHVMQSSALSFDVSCLEVRLTLLSGATLVIADTPVMAGSSTTLRQFIDRQRISHLFLTPSVLASHTADALPDDITLILTGEATPRATLERFQHCRHVLNLYGPSEATVISINPRFSPQDTSLGRTIDSMRTYVLDPQQQLLPPGTVGELYAAGSGLATGYLGQPDMTQKRFVTDLFCPQQRMYATGDRVYQTLDGRLLYVGRKDDQVKLRGLRIELDEVRNALLQYPDVEEAHVTIETHPEHGQLLVGYVRANSAIAQNALKASLRRTLPGYMVPSMIHTLDSLPLTANGKLDKRRLRDVLAQQRVTLDTRADAANDQKITATEAMICDIFASVLKCPSPIAPDQDFFLLGGHSLLAFQVLQQVKAAFGIELNIAEFMEHATPRDVVRMIFSDHQYDSFAPLLCLRPGKPGHTPIFCFHPAGGIGWPYAGLLKYFPAEWPVYVLQSPSLKDSDYQPSSLDAIASDYIIRMRSIQPSGPYHLIGWSFGGHIAHTIASMLQAEGERVDSLAMVDNYPRPSTKFTADDVVILSRLAQAVLNKKAEEITDWDADLSNAMGLPKTQQKILDMVVREFKTALGLMQSCNIRHFDGDMFFIRAKEDTLRDADQVPATWAPHISGDVIVKEVGFTHEAIMQTRALPSFAPELTAYIKMRLDAGRDSSAASA